MALTTSTTDNIIPGVIGPTTARYDPGGSNASKTPQPERQGSFAHRGVVEFHTVPAQRAAVPARWP